MDLKILLDTPPWDWPRDTGKTFLTILTNRAADPAERLIAAELAGDICVVNDELSEALLAIVRSADEPEELRARAAISFGPVLEQSDTDGFDDPDDVPISQRAFRNIQKSLQSIYADKTTPKEVRRRILEASVRAPQDWHPNAIRAACFTGDKEWLLTAVFCMRFVRGFDHQILEALKSTDAETRREAIHAAGNWEIDSAWPHVAALVKDPRTPRPLLLAAIEAAANIRPKEAQRTLSGLAASRDKEIAETAQEAIDLARATELDEEDEENTSDWIN